MELHRLCPSSAQQENIVTTMLVLVTQAIALLATYAVQAQQCQTQPLEFVQQATTAQREQLRQLLARLDTTMKEQALRSFLTAKLVQRAYTVPKRQCQSFQKESSLMMDLPPLPLLHLTKEQ